MCEPLKKHLVQVGEDEEERPSLSEVGVSIVAELNYALKRAKTIARDDTRTEKDRLDATARILKIGNTAAKVLESARKLQSDGLAVVQSMSFIERAKLFVAWFLELPPPYQTQLLARMESSRAERQKPVLEIESDERNKALPEPNATDVQP